MPRHPHGETITRQRGSAILDPYSGEETDISWDDPNELPIEDVAVEPLASFEVRPDGTRVRVEFDVRLYLPYQADIRPLDRAVVRGVTYDVHGERSDWRNPYTGDEPGSTVICKKVDG